MRDIVIILIMSSCQQEIVILLNASRLYFSSLMALSHINVQCAKDEIMHGFENIPSREGGFGRFGSP